jgi:hypothetical protein
LASPRAGLRWHFQLGQLLRSLVEDEQQPVSVADLARKLNLSVAKVYQHLWFAGAYKLAVVARLEEKKIPWSFVIALMGVADKGQRANLLLRAAEGGWTLARLRLELRSTRPAQGLGGRQRKRRQSQGAAVDVARLEGATREWLDLFAALGEKAPGVGEDLQAEALTSEHDAQEQRQKAIAEVRRLAADEELQVNWTRRLRELVESLWTLSRHAATLAELLEQSEGAR